MTPVGDTDPVCARILAGFASSPAPPDLADRVWERFRSERELGRAPIIASPGPRRRVQPAAVHLIWPAAVAAATAVGVEPVYRGADSGAIRWALGASVVLLLVAAFGLVRWQFGRDLWSWMGVLYRLEEATQSGNRPFLETLVTARLYELDRTIDELLRGTFRPDPPESMIAYFQSFFQEGGDIYVGVDSHLPSEYLRTYDWYLKVHGQFCEDEGRMSRRVVVANRNDLTRDYLKDSSSYLKFWGWHSDHGVPLGWIEPAEVEQLRQRYGIPAGTDIALWRNHAVLFHESLDGPRLSITFRDDGLASPTWDEIEAFTSEVVAGAKSFDAGPPGLDLVDDDCAQAWEGYVDPATRLGPSGGVGRFLLEHLEDSRHILDAAAGIGCESVFLLQRGFSVVSNEVDARLQAVAADFAARHEVRLDLRNHPWETLAEDLPGAMKFDAVLCLGNSLCLVDERALRRRCVKSFRSVLSRRGRLFVDERNFEYMLANREQILADPLVHFPPANKPDVMYRGAAVRGVPVRIESNEVHWRLFDRWPVKDPDDIERHYRGRHAFVLHPFRYGELYRLLQECGFGEISVFADLHPVSRPGTMPTRESLAKATFITYVATAVAEDELHSDRPPVAVEPIPLRIVTPGADRAARRHRSG